MSKDETYIKLYRSIINHEIWTGDPFSKGQAWVDLLLMANWGTTTKLYKGQVQKIERGQVQTSLDYLAKRWSWSRNKVVRFLDVLGELGMVTKNGTANGTTLTLENYDAFQDSQNADGQPDGTPDGQQKKNNKKNNKKERVVFDQNGIPHLEIVEVD